MMFKLHHTARTAVCAAVAAIACVNAHAQLHSHTGESPLFHEFPHGATAQTARQGQVSPGNPSDRSFSDVADSNFDLKASSTADRAEVRGAATQALRNGSLPAGEFSY